MVEMFLGAESGVEGPVLVVFSKLGRRLGYSVGCQPQRARARRLEFGWGNRSTGVRLLGIADVVREVASINLPSKPESHHKRY